MQITKVKIGDIRINPDNPRIIKDYKFKKLVKSIKGTFPIRSEQDSKRELR